MPLYAAGKVFVSMIVLLWITGPVVLHYALYRRLDLWPLAASFFAFNAAATWGLVNYVFGAGFFFFALAAWIATEQTGIAKRVAMLSAMCFLLFFCHLGGLALYAFSVGILELARLRSTLANPKENIVRRWIPAAAQFVVPAAIFLFLTPTGPRYGSGGLTATDFAFPTLGHIAHGLRSPAFIELGSIDYVALIAVLAVAAYGILSGKLRFHPRLMPVLVALGVVSFLSIIVIVDQNQFVPNVRTYAGVRVAVHRVHGLDGDADPTNRGAGMLADCGGIRGAPRGHDRSLALL